MKIKITSDDDADFDDSNLPRLGRPLTAGAPRTSYVKYYLTADEMQAFHKIQNETKELYKKEGYSFNAPEHFRMFVKFYSHPALLRLFFADFEFRGIEKHDFAPFDEFINDLKKR